MGVIQIRKYRELHEMTQKELAEQLGVTPSAVTMWESGERKPDIIMLKKLASIFDCTTDELLETININIMEEN